LPFLAAAWAEDQGELLFLFRMLKSQGWIEEPNDLWCQITGPGWSFLQTRSDLLGKTCFVAMSFDPTLSKIFFGPISKGIRKAGYNALRVDDKEHNNDITDEILAGIRTSKFLLADFTLHRKGVYYEAGFAEGLGKPVVRTVCDDDKDRIHFDTRQLNHIIWRSDALDDFAKRITARIIATIGRGPVPVLGDHE
jgi:hypothetical protein